ncbi:hypothetical protein, partial [Pseudomonas viridiflava]|uniref:hypothetical protein n=1 Tax=Pseudomonas viridiflava TaxID=33069 RepID=UPI0019D0F3A9
ALSIFGGGYQDRCSIDFDRQFTHHVGKRVFANQPEETTYIKVLFRLTANLYQRIFLYNPDQRESHVLRAGGASNMGKISGLIDFCARARPVPSEWFCTGLVGLSGGRGVGSA